MRAGVHGPVDVAVLELLEEAAVDGLLLPHWEAQLGVSSLQLLVLRADSTVHDVEGTVWIAGQYAVLELLDLAVADLVRLGYRVLEVAALEAVLAPGVEEVLRDRPGAGLRGPVDGAMLEVDVASATVGGLLLTGLREAQPGGRATELGVACADAADNGVRTGLRGPVGGTGLEVLGLAALGDVILVVHAGADDAGLGGLSDGANRGAVSAAVTLVQAEGVSDVGPCLGHLELPVLPAVDTGRAELDDRLDAGALGVVNEGLGGHARDCFQAHAGHVGLALRHGA